MKAPQAGRVAALGYVLQRDVAPSIGVATDRYLLGTLGRRARPGVLRVYAFPGDVLAAGRWHMAPAGAADLGEAFVRRLTGGRALALGEGYLGISLLLPHRSALLAEDPFALAAFQVPNRYVRGLMRALKQLGLPAFYPGRDLVTVNRRPIAAVSFETDEEGRLLFEAIVAIDRPLSAVAQLLDRWDTTGSIKADLLALEGGTSLREEIGETPAIDELGTLVREAFAEQFGVAIADEPLSALETQAVTALAAREGRSWSTLRQPRPDLPFTGTSGIQTGCSRRISRSSRDAFSRKCVSPATSSPIRRRSRASNIGSVSVRPIAAPLRAWWTRCSAIPRTTCWASGRCGRLPTPS